MARASRSRSADDPTRRLVIDLARLAEDDHCEDIVVLDLHGRSPVTDYFIIATGTSDRQRLTVADDAIELARANAQPVLGASGREQPDWVLIDMVDIVVHVFEVQTRGFYDLEMLWGDAPKVRWKRPRRRGEGETPGSGDIETPGPRDAGTPGSEFSDPPDADDDTE